MPNYQTLDIASVNRMISLEAYGDISFSEMAQRLRSFLPNLRKGLTDIANSLKPEKIQHHNFKDEDKFLDLIKTKNYLDLRYVQLQVPLGFDGNLLEALKNVHAVSAELKKMEKDILLPYRDYLVQCIANRTPRMSHDTQDTKAWAELARMRQEHAKTMRKFYGAHSSKEIATYEKIIARNAEWPEIMAMAKQINEDLSSVDMARVKMIITECASHLDSLFTNLSEGGEFAQESAQKLSQGATVIAEHVELFALTRFRMLGFQAAIDRAIESLMKAI